MSLRDQLITDVKQVGNETLTAAVLYYAIALTGVDEMIFSPGDGQLVSSIKAGAVSSVVNVVGAMGRKMYPMLAVFGADQ